MKTNTLPLACDHAGYKIKEIVKQWLIKNNYDVYDFGTNSEESVDYPDFIHPLASDIQKGKYKRGIVICGSGNGASMVANKYKGVRCANCWNKELARLAREHNDANVLAIPARFVTEKDAIEIIDVFLKTEFEGGRHLRRIEKIDDIQ